MSYDDIYFNNNDSFLVTGGAGFIGSNLCEALVNMGCKVRCLDNLYNGNQKNVDFFLNNPNYSFIKGDIRDYETCLNACRDVDYVLHQAAIGSVQKSIDTPLLYEEINIKGTLNMMEAARQTNVRKFIYASSASVYGDSSILPQKEGSEGSLLSPYAITKKTNEEYGKLYKKLFRLDTYGLRYFNVFGKRQNSNSPYAAVIPKFINQLLYDEQPIINGDGQQSRDFTYIENVIEANLKACKAPAEASGHVYNIAFGERKNIVDIYENICRILNKDIPPVFSERRRGDITHSSADISKARRMLNYNPGWSFDKGIIPTIKWYKSSC